MNRFVQLRDKLRELAHLNASVGLLVWDQEVFMPAGAAGIRAEILATIQGLVHEKFIQEGGPLIKELNAESPEGLTEFDLRNLKRMKRDIERQEKLPKQHVMDMAKATSEAYHAWAEAREKSDFQIFAPQLQKLIDLRIREAEYIGYEENPYDALIDTYEPEMKASILRKVFEPFKVELRGLLDQIKASKQVDESFLDQHVSQDAQMSWSDEVLAAIGFDLNKGRQDVSVHPFTLAMHPTDVRLTTRVSERDIREMLYSTIHEAGHGIYEQGLNPSYFGLPAGEACSLGIHESQSRLWENNVARSLEFWEHFFPQMAELFPDQLKGKAAFDMFKAVNRVEPNFIRISSDELTYHFHILLRTELEDDLINRRLKVDDLPTAWNAKVKEYLGIAVPNDGLGVLQDIHWSHGSIGYFPTYSLGSFYAAQFMAQAEIELPDLKGAFARGDFRGLKEWLNTRIHAHGRTLNAEETCKLVTGKGLDVSYFIRYAKEKFGQVYGITIA